jgi:hypothetical protein
MVVAEWFINLLGAYTGIGLLFAIAFLAVGISQVDPDSMGSGVGFRLIILPGVAALRPVLLTRWVGKGRVLFGDYTSRSAH